MKAPTDPRFPDAQLLTAREVAALLRIHPRSVWRATSAGDIPKPIRIGPKVVRWRLSDLQAFIGGAA
jgi:predicted DNA-binding transcriptional regulator AlpA